MSKYRTEIVSLVGLSGAGKSTLAPLLAKKLGFEAVSLDYLIEQSVGTSISQIFKTRGEGAFRQIESTQLAQKLRQPGSVLDLGAGIVTLGENREVLRAASFVVWLRAPLEILVARLEGAIDRPLLSGSDWKQNLAQMWRSRELLYRSVADLELDTSAADPQQLVELIANEIDLSRKD